MCLKKIVLLFLTQLAFAQSPDYSVLENKIYNSVDAFVANPNEETLKKLELQEKQFKPKIASEFLALVILNCNKAYYQNLFGQTKKSISSYEKAWQLFDKNKLSNYDIIESCLKPLGNLYTIIGDYENAENTIKHYFYIANSEKNKDHKFAAIINLSTVYNYSGKHLEAIDLLEKTINSEKLSNVQKGILCNNLGNNFLAANKTEKAVSCYKTSINFLKNSNETESLSNAYRNRALISNDLKLFEKAKEIFLKNKKNSPRQIAKMKYDEAFLYYQNNKFIEAQNAVKQVFKVLIPNYSKSTSILPNKNSLYTETTLLDALDLQSEIYLTQNLPQKALQSYQLSFHIEELLQSLLVYENSKIITQIRNRNRTEKCINIYFSLYQKEKKINYLEQAFVLQEQTKSAVLKQYVADSKTKSREEKLILEQLQNWNTIILKEQQKLNLAKVSVINEAIKKQNELMLLLKSKKNDNGKKQDDLDLSNLYLKLKKDKAILVEYFSGAQNIFSFTLENGTIKVKKIENTNVKTHVFYKYISCFGDASLIETNVNEFSNLSYSVWKLFDFPSNATFKNLIIIPDGILNFLPFESLISKKTNTVNFSKMHYLLNDFEISYNNSAAFYLNSTLLQYKKESVLGVFPIFENSSLELTFSKNELQFLKATLDGNYLEKQKAIYTNFKQNAANYSILHLSTHASSGDVFEPASIRFYDQEIMYSQLYNLNINPNLVVLSACETGLGKWYKAEGAMSVARGFQYAGAQNLLFSLWKVNDYTTSIFMEKFYKNIKKGKSYSSANHQAKLDFLADESISNAKKSPYYWSAFVYYGTLESNSSTNYLWWISILAGLIGLFLIFKLKKNARDSKNPKEKQIPKNKV